MKKILFSIAVVLCFVACTEDLSEYYDRLQKLESAEKAKEDEIAKRQQTIADLEAQLAEQERWNAEQERRNAEEAAEQAAQEAAQTAQEAANDAQVQQNADQTQQNAELDQQNAELAQQNAELAQQNGSQSAANDSLQQLIDAQGQRNSDLTDRYGDMEQQNSDQQGRNNQLRPMWEQLQERLRELEQRLNAPADPRLLTMELLKSENPRLSENVKCTIVGDSMIECWLPGIVLSKKLIPHFSFEGTLVTIDGYEAHNGKTQIDFSRPRTVMVGTSAKKKYYTMFVHSWTGLPLLYINTKNKRAVTSKDVYITGSFQLIEDVRTRAAGDIIDGTLSIKGRGNSSWHRPKKPYRLKLDEKLPLLDMHKDKNWVLIPNYPDKTMLRNHVANYMGRISNLDYTPESHFVELIFNDEHQGTYQLCEKLRISDHRVAVGDDGFLLEVDHRATTEDDARYFSISHLENVVNVKDPDVEYNDANYNYVRDFMTRADAALFSTTFRDVNNGWQKYLDMDSFVEWYIINEISKNLDSKFYTSCYMNLKRGGKLKMGPLWDYDVAFGNMAQDTPADAVLCRTTTGFYIKNAKWFTRLFQDPAFVAKVKERYNYFYRHKNDILQNINADAQYLKYSVNENDAKWDLFNRYTWTNYNIWGSYQNEVQYLKEFLNERMDWLKSEFDKM